MRASSEAYQKWTSNGGKEKSPRVVESYNGFTSYLIVTDSHTCYTWIFLCLLRDPPTEIMSAFIRRYGNKDGYWAVRVDQGGKLGRSTAFTMAVAEADYVVEPTGADDPNQNGKAERLNRTFGNSVRTLLYAAGLSPRFWSAALVHDAYLKNRLWHRTIQKTPYEAFHGCQPDLQHLRAFGSLVSVCVSGKRSAKLNRHAF